MPASRAGMLEMQFRSHLGVWQVGQAMSERHIRRLCVRHASSLPIRQLHWDTIISELLHGFEGALASPGGKCGSQLGDLTCWFLVQWTLVSLVVTHKVTGDHILGNILVLRETIVLKYRVLLALLVVV